MMIPLTISAKNYLDTKIEIETPIQQQDTHGNTGDPEGSQQMVVSLY